MNEPDGEPEQPDTVRPGLTRVGERRYFRLPGGRVAVRYVAAAQGDAEVSVPPPEGGVEISADRAERLIAEHRDRLAAHLSHGEDQRAQARRADYEQLTALGLAPGAAARLSGHQPPADTAEGQ